MRWAKDSENLKHKISSEYILDRKLFEDSYSTVFSAYHPKYFQVSIKFFKEDQLNSLQKEYLMNNEVQTISSLNHQNILRLVEIKRVQGRFMIVSQFCNDGRLEDILTKKQKLDPQKAIQIILGIARGIKHLLQKQLVHRDLKPSNIFLQNGEAKIGNFRLAFRIGHRTLQSGDSPQYMAPEVLQKLLYSQKSQVFAIGVIFYQILSGNVPWKSKKKQDLMWKMKNIKAEKILNCPLQIQNIIFECLKFSIQERLSLQQLIYFLEQTHQGKRKKDKKNYQVEHESRKKNLSVKGYPSLKKKKISMYASKKFDISDPKKKVIVSRSLKKQGIIPKQPTFQHTLISLFETSEKFLLPILRKKFQKILDAYIKLISKKKQKRYDYPKSWLNQQNFLDELIFQSSYQTQSQLCLIIEGFVRIVHQNLKSVSLPPSQRAALELFQTRVTKLARYELEKIRS